jgi:hypothetical protein
MVSVANYENMDQILESPVLSPLKNSIVHQSSVESIQSLPMVQPFKANVVKSKEFILERYFILEIQASLGDQNLNSQ